MAAEALTEYERLRLQNIRRNDEMMNALMLQRKVSDLAASVKRPKPPNAGTPPRKKIKPQSSSPVVIRRSLRSRGLPPDSRDDATAHSPHPSPPAVQPARKRGLISIEEACLEEPASSGRRLLGAIMDMSDNVLLKDKKKKISTWNCSGAEDWDPSSSIVLEHKNVMRFLPGRILCVSFFPARDRTMIVAGDKLGHVGFWDVDYAGEGDGTYLYMPHSSPVSAILVHPFDPSKIFTSSYDGFIRLMNSEKETFNLVYSTEDAIFSASQQSNDNNSLYFGEGYGGLKIWDERIGEVSSSWYLHDSRINSIHFNDQKSNLMVTSSSDGTACIWDLRYIKKTKPGTVKTIRHKKAVHSAYFSPSGGLLATTSTDDHVGIFSGVNFGDESMIAHYNQTGRWISSFRAIWGWDDNYVYVGNMRRAIDVIDSRNRTVCGLESPHMTAIPCRFAAHPHKIGHLAGATAGGQIYLWTK